MFNPIAFFAAINAAFGTAETFEQALVTSITAAETALGPGTGTAKLELAKTLLQAFALQTAAANSLVQTFEAPLTAAINAIVAAKQALGQFVTAEKAAIAAAGTSV